MATNNIALITKYLPQFLDQAMVADSKTRLLEQGAKSIVFDFTNSKTVKIGTLETEGLGNYGRAGHAGLQGKGTGFDGEGHNDGYPVGGTKLTWKNYEIGFDRAIQIRIDSADDEETAGLLMANVVKTLIKNNVIPEVDECRFARMAEKCYVSLGNRVDETINATKGDEHEIIHSFNKAFQFLTEHGVENEDQVIFVSPETHTMLLNTPEIYKTLTQADYKSSDGATFSLEAYMGRPIVEVPSDRFYDKVITTENGFRPASNAKIFNYIICSRYAGDPVTKIAKVKIFTPEQVQDYDGYKVNARLYHDYFIADNKAPAFFISVSTINASTKANSLGVMMREGAVKNSYIIDNAISTPAGILGDLVFSATAINLGETPTAPVKITYGESIVDATNTAGYFALVGADGKAKAVSGRITLTKKA